MQYKYRTLVLYDWTATSHDTQGSTGTFDRLIGLLFTQEVGAAHLKHTYKKSHLSRASLRLSS
jgi:hypothetical protein